MIRKMNLTAGKEIVESGQHSSVRANDLVKILKVFADKIDEMIDVVNKLNEANEPDVRHARDRPNYK